MNKKNKIFLIMIPIIIIALIVIITIMFIKKSNNKNYSLEILKAGKVSISVTVKANEEISEETNYKFYIKEEKWNSKYREIPKQDEKANGAIYSGLEMETKYVVKAVIENNAHKIEIKDSIEI